VLIDSGESRNFIDAALVDMREILTDDFKGFTVIIPRGYKMECTRWIPKLKIVKILCNCKEYSYPLLWIKIKYIYY
jgi:hypothetical protein